jgi:N-methylhydantoinase A/oxoprolinase/acetone carboxylase beta subunit
MLRIGVDVGGTNTDAVVMQGARVLAAVKCATTRDVTSGVLEALAGGIAAVKTDPTTIRHVMIGTTHFTNAVVERRNLSKVAIIRLGLPATASLPPLTGWPEDLRLQVEGPVAMLRGAYEFDGRVLSDLDLEGLDQIANRIAAEGVSAVAITSVFSPVRGSFEERARDHLLARMPGLKITISREIGRIGLIERENATVLNAALLDLADRTVEAIEQALKDSGLTCGFSITQNDGTLMPADRVRQYPVLTFASGPTNSMRGAAFLTGLKDAIVVDVGGTTSDIGALSGGFPRQASSATDIGGVRTSFRMPDVFAIGVGGGSVVSEDGAEVGPLSVGYRITKEAQVFGGRTLTASDVGARLGLVVIGHKTAEIDEDTAQRALAVIHHRLASGVGRTRISAEPITVIAVGGGAFLLPDYIDDLPVIRPDNAGVANAVGAAIAQVSGEVDAIFDLTATSREDALAKAEADARARALAGGADGETITVLEREDVPLAYLPGNATRIRVRVVGDLKGA